MTEEQAITRIMHRLAEEHAFEQGMPEAYRLASVAWNEMKAIALEQGTLPAGWHPATDGKNKPEAWAEYRRAKRRADAACRA